jgi:N-acetylneuraminic acid mutarotase
MHYQGRVMVGPDVFEGTGYFKFALVDADGARAYWRNALDSNGDGQPDGEVALPVSRGLYSVLLGDANQANMASLPPSVFTNEVVYLRVWFNDGVHGSQKLAPDQRVAAVGYSLMAASVADGSVTAAKLAPDALDASKFIAGELPDARLGTNVVRQADLGRRLGETNEILAAKLAELNARIDALAASLQTNLPAGLTLASTDGADARLLGLGYQRFHAVAAPDWVKSSASGEPIARHGHSAVWTGEELITWGGMAGAGLWLSGGGRYRPANDTWTTVSPVSAPSARWRHSAVWTGRAMLVWGGSGAGGFLGSGASYVPADQQWTALPGTGAPEGREGHGAVWTGTQMLVWGGRNATGLLTDAAAFDPDSNIWRTIGLPNAPEGREGACVVWTGNALLVWGGLGATGLLDTGARLGFDASGNAVQWQAMSRSGALSARSGHTAVWTGSRVLIWGGVNASGNPLADGAAYDPVADLWVSIPSFNAPSARSGHRAVWTGAEMLVLNGLGVDGEFASGAAYDPASGAWRALSAAGNPLARTDAIAVWDGAEVIVFGGRAGGQVLGSLQRLVPQPAWFFYRKL